MRSWSAKLYHQKVAPWPAESENSRLLSMVGNPWLVVKFRDPVDVGLVCELEDAAFLAA